MKQPFGFELFNTSDKGTSQVWGGHLSQGRFISPPHPRGQGKVIVPSWPVCLTSDFNAKLSTCHSLWDTLGLSAAQKRLWPCRSHTGTQPTLLSGA